MLRTGLPLFLCVLLGWTAWRIHHPGIIGADGMTQLLQAWGGRFEDWYPPAMAVAMRQVWLLTGTFNHIALVQSVLGCLGIFACGRASLRFAFPNLLSPGRQSAVALAMLVVLFQPLSPLIHMLVYIQNDAWLLIALLWSVAGWLRLESDTGPSRWFWWSAAIGGSAVTVLARHNAVLLLPVFALLAAQSAFHRGRVAALLAACFVAAFPLAIEKWLVHHYRVHALHPEDQIMALDLVGVCIEDEESRAALPYTNAHLIEAKWREKYHFAFVNVMYHYSPESERPTDVNFVGVVENGVQRLGSRHDELAADYRRAMGSAPLALAGVKLKAFQLHLIHDHPGEKWHPIGVVDNPFGLKPDPSMAAPRRWLETVDRAVSDSPTLRFLCTNHLPWFVVCLLGTGFAAGLARRGGRRERIGFLIVLLPLIYYLTHLLAVAGAWYRYMYPAALLMQIGAFTAAAGVAIHAARRWQTFRAKNCISLTPPLPRLRTAA